MPKFMHNLVPTIVETATDKKKDKVAVVVALGVLEVAVKTGDVGVG